MDILVCSGEDRMLGNLDSEGQACESQVPEVSEWNAYRTGI